MAIEKWKNNKAFETDRIMATSYWKLRWLNSASSWTIYSSGSQPFSWHGFQNVLSWFWILLAILNPALQPVPTHPSTHCPSFFCTKDKRLPWTQVSILNFQLNILVANFHRFIFLSLFNCKIISIVYPDCKRIISFHTSFLELNKRIIKLIQFTHKNKTLSPAFLFGQLG